MDSETPKPMKKVPRNILGKVGRKLEKFEKNLGLQTPTVFYSHDPSLNDLSSHSHHRDSQISEDQEDAASLQSVPQSDSPKATLRHQHGNPLDRSHSSTLSTDSDASSIRQSNVDESDPSRQYDHEMRIICEQLQENKRTNLHDCREYDKKVSLLRIAVSFNTPKVTVPVLLYLENTLSKRLFYELLKKHPSAVKNYINLAKFRLDNDYYIAMLKQFNRNEDVAMIRLRQASQTHDTISKIALLDQAAIDIASHRWWHLQIGEYNYILHKQREIQRTFSTNTNIRLENRTVIDTYKILYDIDFRQQKQLRHTDKTSAERYKEMETICHMSPEMMLCSKLCVIMQCGFRTHYEDFVHQALHQSIFGKKYIIPPENFADMVYNWVRISGEGQEKASEKAERFLNLIQDPGTRIYYAEKFLNYDVAMDTIANTLRDRAQLEGLRKRIPPDHPSFNRATSLLENVKWRN